MRQADFHCHSTFSDGTLSPRMLVTLAKEIGLKGLALTDHDTLEGVPEFLEAGKKKGFSVFAGVELSLNFKGTTHLLGLKVIEGEKDLDLSFLQDYRRERNEKIFSALTGLGIGISWERVQALSGDGQMGKPHFAKALVERGEVSEFQEAFHKYLGKGKPAYIEKRRLSPPEAIKLLLEAGYAPVLAHSVTLGIPLGEYKKVLSDWKDWGLVGLEVYHPDHFPDLFFHFKKLSSELGLVMTSGSDYHGANKKTPLTWTMVNSPLQMDKVLEGLIQGTLKNAASLVGNQTCSKKNARGA